MRNHPAVAVVLLTLLALARAQDYRAKIQGVVTDTSQAVVPGARVVLLNTQTGVSVMRETSPRGQYLFDLVEPGAYKLTCEHTGFSKFVQEEFIVEVRGDVTVNIALKLGQVSDTVTVSTTPVAVQFNSSSMELIVDRTMLDELPNIARNPFNLTTLDPTVVQKSVVLLSSAFPWDMFVSDGMNVDGPTNGKNELLLDGAPVMAGNRGSYSPPMDAVQEFAVQQNSVDAQYGRNAGGVVSLVSKSGTNQSHGTAYYFGRNPAINARSNAIANTINQTRNSIMGGTVGGPIKKNKLFNFLVFEDWRATEFRKQLNKTQPTALQKTGDFSKTLNRAGQMLPIYDPWTTQLLNPTTATRTPFAGSIIPASRIDPTARRVMQDVPLPNNPGDDIMGDNNLKAGLYLQHKYWNFTDRTDWNPSDKWKVYGRFSRFQDTDAPNYYAASPGLGLNGGIMDSQNIAADAVYTINPNMFLNLRVSAAWVWDDLRDPNSEITSKDLASFWPNNPWYQSYLKDTPHLFYPSFGVLGRATGSAYWVHGTTANAAATLAQQRGKHYLKFGGEFSRFAEYNYNPVGMGFSSDASLTANTYLSPDTGLSGNPFASFLTGALSSGTDAYTAPQDMRVNYYGLFIQDDYKITRKLTLNLGLRWEYETPPAEVNNIYTRYLDLTNPIPELQATPPQIPAVVKNYANVNYQWNGALVFANQSHPGLWNNNTHNFMPRIGGAYAFNSKTALRFGYARYINPPMDLIAATADSMLLGPAYGYSVTSTALAPLTGIPQATLSNPFPSSNPLLPIPGQSLGRYTQLGGPVSWNDQQMRTGVNDRYNLSLQRQLPGNILADGTFFMIQSHDLPYARNMNQMDPNLTYTYKAALSATVANPFYNYLTPNLFPGPLRNQPNVSIANLLTPHPQYQALSQSNTPGFLSHTYSAQVRVRRSFSHGFGFTASYNSAWTRNTAFFDPIDSYLSRPTFQDTANPRHGVNVSGTYELPMGKGRPLLSGAPRVVNLLIGGWSSSPIFSYNSGAPLQFGVLQVVKSGSPKLDNPARQQWFDTSFFKTAVANTPRSNPLFYPGLTGPRQWNIDSTLSKYFRIRERYRVELRMEAYNLLNKIMWGAPPVAVNNALFGKVTTQSNSGREFQYTLRIHF